MGAFDSYLKKYGMAGDRKAPAASGGTFDDYLKKYGISANKTESVNVEVGSGVFNAPETFSPSKPTEPSTRIVEGTGLGLGVTMPGLDDIIRADAKKKDEQISATGLGVGMNLPSQKQATSALVDVSKKAHEDATQELEQLKKDRRASRWDPSARNPESENFKTNDQWTAEMIAADDKIGRAAKNYYEYSGQDAVYKVLETDGARDALNSAAEAAAEALALQDNYRNGGDQSMGEYLNAAYGKQARAMELLLKTGVNKDVAQKAVDYLAEKIRTEKAAEYERGLQEWAKENKVGAAALSVLTSPTQGIDYIGAIIGNAGSNSAKNIESYRPLTGADFRGTAATQALREGASSDMGGVGKFLFDTGMSIADSTLLVSTIGPAAGVVLGMGAASSATKDALERGASNGQAFAVGATAGVAEMLFEKVSIDRLLSIKDVSTLKTLMTNVLKQAGTEASEEALTEISNIMMDSAIMGQSSNFAQAVKAYQRQGLSEEEAKKRAYLDNIKQVGLAALGGALSGGVMGGGASTASYVSNKTYQNYLAKNLNTNQINALSVAQEFAQGSDTRTLADQISSAIDAAASNEQKVEISADMWGRLMKAMEAERDQFGPKDPGGSSPVDAVLHPKEETMNPTSRFFTDAGDNPKAANTKSKIFARVMQGDTSLTDKELRTLDLNSKETRAAFKTALGVELPGTSGGHELVRAARNVVKSIADRTANQQSENDAPQTSAAEMDLEAEAARMAEVQEQAKQAAVDEAVQEAEIRGDEAAQNLEAEVAKMAESQTAQMSEPVQMSEPMQIAEQQNTATETQIPATEPVPTAEQRASVGEVSPQNSVAPEAIKTPQRGSAKSLLDYVNRVNQINDTVRQRTQETTVKVLNSNLKALGATATIEVKSLGKDGPSAQWNPDGSIELNADALSADGGFKHASQWAIVYTLTHELFHEASGKQGGESSQWTKAQANELIEFGKNRVGEEKWASRAESMRNAQISAMMKDGYTREQAEARLTEDYLNEELAADVLRDVFASQGKLNLFAKEHRSTLTKIRDWLQKKFDAMLGRPDAGNHELVQEMNRIIKNVNEALTKTVERGTDKAETTTQEAKYSAEGREETDPRAGEISGRLREPGSDSQVDVDEANGRRARNERAESRGDFLERVKASGKKVRFIKGAAVAYRTVPFSRASGAARAAVQAARALGHNDVIVFTGSLEFNHNGVTGYPSREASTLGKEVIAFGNSLSMAPIEAAAHEVAHKWMSTARGKAYQKFVLSQYKSGTKFEAELREAYKPEKVDEEKVAYLSGWMEDDPDNKWLSKYVDDPEAVRAEWEKLKSVMVGKKFSPSVTPEMDAEYTRAVEKDDMETAQRMVDEAANTNLSRSQIVNYRTKKLKKVYHATNAKFTVFDKSKFGTNTGSAFGEGFYFTDDERYARTYAKNVGVYYLDIRNPYFYDDWQPDELLSLLTRAGYDADADFLGSIEEGSSVLEQDLLDEVIPRAVRGVRVTSRDFSGMLRDAGFDGIIAAEEYIAFEPEQIKSADPVTYDDDGNVIPLSERFNSENDDIRYSVPTLADTNTEEFRQWFNDDSGELTNPDGTPKWFLRGSPLSGPTKFRDYRESHSPGIFFTPDLYAAKNYATKRTTQYGAPEFIPRHLSTWNEAFQWVDNGGLGYFVSLEREGPEWVFAKRDATLPYRWVDVATYPNTQEGLDKFNAEYGDLMRNVVFKEGRAANPGYMSTYLTATKTKVIDAQGRVWLNVDKKWGSTDDMVREAWDEGYDCVVIKNVQDGGEEIGVGFDDNDNYVTIQKPIDIVIVKDSGQVKSVYNTGSFDRNNPDVRYSPNTDYQTGGNTGNVNPETGFRRGSVADSFMRMWNIGAQDEALNTLEYILTRLAELEAEAQERNLRDLRAAVFKSRVTPDMAERNRQRIERLIKKYGMIPQTSGAQQEVRLPEQIDDKTYVAGATQTILSHSVTNELLTDELVQDILSGNAGVTYARIGDRETLKQVDDEFERQGVDGLMKQWKNKVNSGDSMTKLDIARAEKLFVELAGAKEFTDEGIRDILNLVAEISAAGTQAGQTVQAMTMLKKMTPTGQLYYIQKAVDRLNRDPRQKSPITINEQLAKKLAEAKTTAEINAAVDEIIADIAQKVPVSLADKWNTWRYFAMLGNPRTHIRNLLGNAIFSPARLAKDAIGTLLEKALPQNQRTKALTASKELREFAEQDAEEMQDILRGGGKYNPSDMIRDKRKIFKRAEWLNKATQKNSELLEKEDWIFLGRAYQRALAGFLSARGVTDTDSLLDTPEGRKTLNEAREYAVHEAQRATYRDMSKLAGTLNHLKRNHKALGLFLDGIVPFTKTPINIVKRGFEYSPLGLAKTIYDAVNRGVAVKQIGKGETVKRDFKSAAEIIDELSANLTGTGVVLLGYLLAKMGLLTAGLGDDDEDKFKELYGEQAYSLNIPGVGSYTIDWMAPVALPLFVGAEIFGVKTEGYDGLSIDEIADGLTTILEPMLSLSMLDGLNDALSANKFGDSSDALWNIASAAIGSYLSQGIPTVFGQVARTIDPSRRTSFTEKGAGVTEATLQRFWQSSVQGKVPFYENEKMAYIDAWGRTDTTGSVLVRAVENFLSPGYVNASRKTDVETELERLAAELKDTSVMPDRAQKYFTVDKETYAMSQDEYQAHLIDRGQTSYALVNDFLHDRVYDGLTDKERAKVIGYIYDYAAQNAKYHTTEAYERDTWISEMDDYISRGGDAVDYLTMKAQTNRSTTMSEVAYQRSDLTASEMSSLILGDVSSTQRAPSTFADPYAKGYEYKLTDEQKARYTETYDRLFNERFPDLYASDEYQDAAPEERKELVAELRADVASEVKYEIADWLWEQGIESELK